MTEDRFGLVVICTGNRFRSALAAAVFRSLTAGLPVDVTSCGTLDVGPMPALEGALEAARRLGLDLSEHAARALRRGALRDADLVLGFERAHLVAAVAEGGARREIAFTLPELVDALPPVQHVAADPVARARAAIAAAAALRPSDPAAWSPRELGDPLGRRASEQREIAADVARDARRAAERLFGISKIDP